MASVRIVLPTANTNTGQGKTILPFTFFLKLIQSQLNLMYPKTDKKGNLPYTILLSHMEGSSYCTSAFFFWFLFCFWALLFHMDMNHPGIYVIAFA